MDFSKLVIAFGEHMTRGPFLLKPVAVIVLAFVLCLCFQCCTDDSPVAPAPDPCCRVADSLQARVDLLEYQVCVLTLLNNEREHQINCVSDWLANRGERWPSSCDGRPIDLKQCQGAGR